MKKLLILLSASALISTFAFAESAVTDQKGGQDRDPEKVSQEMGKQDKGNAYGQGQGMMQGKHKGMEQGQGQKMMKNQEQGQGMMQKQGQGQNKGKGGKGGK